MGYFYIISSRSFFCFQAKLNEESNAEKSSCEATADPAQTHSAESDLTQVLLHGQSELCLDISCHDLKTFLYVIFFDSTFSSRQTKRTVFPVPTD